MQSQKTTIRFEVSDKINFKIEFIPKDESDYSFDMVVLTEFSTVSEYASGTISEHKSGDALRYKVTENTRVTMPYDYFMRTIWNSFFRAKRDDSGAAIESRC